MESLFPKIYSTLEVSKIIYSMEKEQKNFWVRYTSFRGFMRMG
jgi:hypothetical protein